MTRSKRSYKTVRIGLTIPEPIRDAWKEEAKKRYLTLTDFIRQIVDKEIQNKPFIYTSKKDNYDKSNMNKITQFYSYNNFCIPYGDFDLNKLLKDIEDNPSYLTLYFIQSKRGDPIKIGITKDIKQRMIAYNTHNPNKMKLLTSISKVEPHVETFIHSIFDDNCIKNEWFEESDEILDLIDKINKYYQNV